MAQDVGKVEMYSVIPGLFAFVRFPLALGFIFFFCIWDIFGLHINVTTMYTSQLGMD